MLKKFSVDITFDRRNVFSVNKSKYSFNSQDILYSAYSNINLNVILIKDNQNLGRDVVFTLSSRNYSRFNNPLSSDELQYLLSNNYRVINVDNIKSRLRFDNIPCRLIHGINKNGNEYYRVDVILTKDLIKSIWLTKLNLSTLKNFNFNMNLFEDVETEIDYSDDYVNVIEI